LDYTVLITGANGLLGRVLSSILSDCGFSVISTGKGADVLKGQRGCVYEQMDVTVQQNVEYVLSKYNPDCIINAAALTDVDACEKNHDLCLSVNTHSISYFIPFLKQNDVHLIHVSSDFIFDGSCGPYKEDDPCDPINYYGVSKLEAEKLIINNNLKYTILRTSLLFGKIDDKFNFVTWVKSNLENGSKLNIVDDQYRTATFVYDLADVILKVIQKEKYGVYHVSSGEVLSIYQIVCNIAKCYGLDASMINRIKSKELNQFARRPLNSGLLIKKAIKDFNFKPRTVFNALI
jgi:dTDP-4-dehydrorhamnose reductase